MTRIAGTLVGWGALAFAISACGSDDDVASGDQIQIVFVKVEKPCRIRTEVSIGKRVNIGDTEKHPVNGVCCRQLRLHRYDSSLAS